MEEIDDYDIEEWSLWNMVECESDFFIIHFPCGEDISLSYNDLHVLNDSPEYIEIYCDTEEQVMLWKALIPEIEKIVDEKMSLYFDMGFENF